MPTNEYSKNIVYLSKEQYQELITNETLTVNGQTITYNENDIYVTPQEEPVTDIKINQTSIVTGGVANIPISGSYGLATAESGEIRVKCAGLVRTKAGTNAYEPIVASHQHESAFYGLAKAAGDTTQASSSNAVGSYTENAKSAIQEMIGVTDTVNNASSMLATVETSETASQDYAVGDLLVLGSTLYKVTSAITLGDTLIPDGNIEQTTVEQELAVANNDVTDVQIDGTSIVQNGIATIPMMTDTTLGIARVAAFNGTKIINGVITTNPALEADCKAGTTYYKPVTSREQHFAAFYGLAKAAGDTTQSQSSNAVGTYTDEAKSAIQTMLGIDPASIAAQVEIPLVETVSGTTPTITGEPNVRYKCGEVSTITITPPASGSIDVIFDSGSTAAVLTVPNTVRWPEWFDATELETDRTYEILITDGVYGSVMSWAI